MGTHRERYKAAAITKIEGSLEVFVFDFVTFSCPL